MIHLVTADNLHLFAAQLDQMFALRPEPRADRLDDEHAAYLMAADPHGQVDACLRLRGGDHRLAVSRCVRRHTRPGERPSPADPVVELMLGLLEFCDARHIIRVEIAAEPELLASLGALGCPVGEDSAGVRWLAPSPAMLAAARSVAGVRVSVLASASPKREHPGLSAGASR